MAEKKIPYYNRELSWMDFNARVLEEATKKENCVFWQLPAQIWMNFLWYGLPG